MAHLFETEFSTIELPFLLGHKVYGKVVVPGAAYCEMALAAARAVFGQEQVQLENLSIQKPMFLEDRPRQVQTVLEQEGNQWTFRIASRLQKSKDPWVTHAVGEVAPLASVAPALTADGAAALRDRYPREFAVDALYKEYDGLGLDYADAFKSVRELRGGKNEAFVRVDLNGRQSSDDQYYLHPGLLDGCFQAALEISTERKTSRPFVPVGLNSLRLFRKPTGPLSARLKLVEEIQSGELSTRILDISVSDDGGIVSELSGLMLREAKKEALLEASSVDDWFHEVAWSEWVRTQTESAKSGAWLVFEDASGLGHTIADQLRAAGEKVKAITAKEISPDREDGYLEQLKAFANEKSLTLLHFWSLDSWNAERESGVASESFEALQRDVYQSGMFLIQSILKSGLAKSARLVFVTRGGLVTPGLSPTLSQSTVAGIIKTLALEHPEMRAIQIDLDPIEGNLNLARLQDLASSTTGEQFFAVRSDGKIWVPRLKRSVKAAQVAGRTVVRKDATYLITGGFGGLGLQFANWLARQGARSIALVGRNPPGSQTVSQIKKLEESGVKVSSITADISNKTALSRALEGLQKNDSLPKLAGIIHAAGALADSNIENQSLESFAASIRPKILGALNLHALTQNDPLDFFVMFSSTTSLLGNRGQLNYAAANSFLDAFAGYRRSAGLPALSINWGPWDEVGMAAKSPRVREILTNQGMNLLPLNRGLDAFGELLLRDTVKPIVQTGVMDFNWPVYLENLPNGSKSPFFSGLLSTTKPAARPAIAAATSASTPGADAGPKAKNMTDETPLLRKLTGLPSQERVPALKAYLLEEASRILGRPLDERADSKKGFIALGMDSLIVLDFRNAIKKSFGKAKSKSLPTTLLFNYPNIDALADYLASQL